jgi:hypothetical protein
MLPETITSLFGVADKFAVETTAVLALIWSGTLGYVIVRKVSSLVRRLRAARTELHLGPVVAEGQSPS